jgi:hypothetical protein
MLLFLNNCFENELRRSSNNLHDAAQEEATKQAVVEAKKKTTELKSEAEALAGGGSEIAALGSSSCSSSTAPKPPHVIMLPSCKFAPGQKPKYRLVPEALKPKKQLPRASKPNILSCELLVGLILKKCSF